MIRYTSTFQSRYKLEESISSDSLDTIKLWLQSELRQDNSPYLIEIEDNLTGAILLRERLDV